jgi:hypothetical protein
MIKPLSRTSGFQKYKRISRYKYTLVFLGLQNMRELNLISFDFSHAEILKDIFYKNTNLTVLVNEKEKENEIFTNNIPDNVEVIYISIFYL